jgi:hypothetical protein
MPSQKLRGWQSKFRLVDLFKKSLGVSKNSGKFGLQAAGAVFNEGTQFRHANRFGHETVHAGCHALFPVFPAGVGSQGENARL